MLLYVSTELIIILTHVRGGVLDYVNENGTSCLDMLATKPSAFKSSSSLGWWKEILYHSKYRGEMKYKFYLYKYIYALDTNLEKFELARTLVSIAKNFLYVFVNFLIKSCDFYREKEKLFLIFYITLNDKIVTL